MGDEGVYPLVLVGVNHDPRPLVHQQQVFVLVDNVQLGLEHRQEGIFRGGNVEELVVDVELEHVALHQPVVPLGPLAVALDPLDADIFLCQGRREQGEGFAQPAVQPLARVVGADGKFPHRFANLSESFLVPATCHRGLSSVYYMRWL